MTADDVARRLGEELTRRRLWRAGALALAVDGQWRMAFTDAATAGVLLDTLWGLPGVTRVETWRYDGGAAVRCDIDGVEDEDEVMQWLHAPTLGEAAARALLASWGVLCDD